MGRLDHDPDALRLESLHQEVRDLLGHPLLHLEATAYISTTRGSWRGPTPGDPDVGDGRVAEEGQQVVLAERVERDVLDDDHLAVADLEDRAVHEALRVDVIAGGQLGVHAVDPLGRRPEPLAAGVLAHLDEDLADGRLDPPIRGERDRGRAGALDRQVGIASMAPTASIGVSPISDSISATSCLRWSGRSGMARSSYLCRRVQTVAPPAVKPAAGSGSNGRPSAPRSQARAFSPSEGRW